MTDPQMTNEPQPLTNIVPLHSLPLPQSVVSSVPSTSTMTKRSIVINFGNGYTKLAYMNGDKVETLKIRSGIAAPSEFARNAFVLNLLNDAGRRRNGYDYNPWVMLAHGDRPSQVEQGKAVYALQLLIGAAWDLIEDGGELELFILVHAPAELRPALTANLAREHDCTYKGERKRFTVTVAKVSKEGSGLGAVDAKQDVLVLDFGADTLIPTRWVNGATSKEYLGNAISQYGTSGLIRRLCEYAPSAIGPNPTEANCIKAIESNKLGDAADAVIADFWQDAIKAVKRNNLQLVTGVDAVYLAGGLTRLKRFVAVAKTDTVLSPKVAPNAQMADVMGFCQLLRENERI